MRRFINKILVFVLLLLVLLSLSLFFIPDVVSKNSLLAALVDKHTLLQKTKSEKIIFIGGSNLSFGLDSKRISNAFNKPVINMGVHAGMGLEYIVNDVKQYINKGDIVVLMPEYENFYTDNFYGEMELVSVVFDIDPAGKKLLNAKQWQHLFKYIQPTPQKRSRITSLTSVTNHKPQAVLIFMINVLSTNLVMLIYIGHYPINPTLRQKQIQEVKN